MKKKRQETRIKKVGKFSESNVCKAIWPTALVYFRFIETKVYQCSSCVALSTIFIQQIFNCFLFLQMKWCDLIDIYIKTPVLWFEIDIFVSSFTSEMTDMGSIDIWILRQIETFQFYLGHVKSSELCNCK